MPRTVRRGGLVAALVLVLALVAAAGASARVRWFHSPTRNIECEVAAHAARGTYAYCQTFERPRSVTLRRNGSMKICRGGRCLGNGPENAFTLHYGHSVRVGPFRCKSLRRGMRCKVIASGRGFLINRRRIRRL